jgi:4-hydroxybenzoate polyprenyltransferase
MAATSKSTLNIIRDVGHNLYLITIDDTPTFVVPNTIFGLSAALTPLLLNTDENATLLAKSSWIGFSYVVTRTILFNWTNLVIFDLANQRDSGKEDVLNKPWRPIPSGRLSSTQMLRWLFVAIPIVLCFSHFCLHVGTESCLLVILTWMYNDLGGGDDNWILRNLIIACAFGVYNLGSLKVAATTAQALSSNRPSSMSNLALYLRPTDLISTMGYVWTIIISAVIFTTMHIQDLKDVAGDRARGRRTAPIIFGRRIAGWTIAVPVMVWSVISVWFWDASLSVAVVPIGLGLGVAWRCVNLNEKAADRRSWQLWCAWTAVLYAIPPLSG